MITWCVAHTHPSKEFIVQNNLLEQGYDVYLPRFKKIRRHARKVDEVLSPLFPRYVFVGMDLEHTQWRSINGTRGVSYLLMSDLVTPSVVSSRVIDDLKSQEIEDGIVTIDSLMTFVSGDKVRVLDGVFKDHIASFEHFDERSRVRLLLSFLGRDMQITLPVHAIEAA